MTAGDYITKKSVMLIIMMMMMMMMIIIIIVYIYTHKLIFLSSAEIQVCQRKQTPLQEFGAFKKSRALFIRNWLLEVNPG
jgi:hypothetical protein